MGEWCTPVRRATPLTHLPLVLQEPRGWWQRRMAGKEGLGPILQRWESRWDPVPASRELWFEFMTSGKFAPGDNERRNPWTE